MSRMMTVLRAVVDRYVETGLPVGSKAILDTNDLGVSPATVRGDLSRLEVSGHLTQPHVSAGRVPTDLGYRAVVDEALSSRSAIEARRLEIRADSVGEAMRQIATAMASMTRCLSIVSDPVSQSVAISRITLVRTRGSQVVLVVVCDDGRVDDRVISCPDLTDSEISRAEDILTALYVGKDVSSASLESYRLDSGVDSFVARASDVIKKAVLRGSDMRISSAGISFLLARPEASESDSMRMFVGDFEEDRLDFEDMLTGGDDGLVIRIGNENADDRLSMLSFVAKEYRVPSGMGFVACVGPTRMDYRTTIGAVEAGAAEAAAVMGDS